VRLLKACAAHPWSVLMASSGVLLFGLVALGQIDVDLLPVIPLPVAQVITEFEDIPAPEVEEMLTVPLENSLSAVKAVKQISSVSKRGISRVTLTFAWSADMELGAVEVREKIDALYPLLPQGCARPVVITEDANARPLLTLAVFPLTGGSSARLGPLLQRELKTRLRQLRGVADVRMVGVEEAEILVEADAFKLYSSGLLLSQLADTLKCSVYDQPVGLLREGQREYPLKISSQVRTLQDLAAVPILGPAGGPEIRVGDLAEVSWGVKERTSFFHYNGREAIGIYLFKAGGRGSLNAAAEIRRELEPLRELFSRELRLELIEDRSIQIRLAVRRLLAAILLGIAAAAGVLLLLSRTILPALLTIASIPVSICAAFLGMRVAGISLNIISLSGMAMGIGLIVDNAIVVLENLCRYKPSGSEAVARTALEMSAPAFGSTATTLLVFLPMIFIPGLIGALFKDLALTVCFLLAASYLTAMTLMPALYALAGSRLQKVSFRTVCLERPYRRALFRLFRRPAISLSACLLLVGAGCLAFSLLPKEALPAAAPEDLNLEIALPRSLKLKEAATFSSAIETSLLTLPQVKAVCAEAGFDKNSSKDRSEKGRDASRLRLRIFLEGRVNAEPGIEAGIDAQLARLGVHSYSLSRSREQLERLLGFPSSPALLLTGPVRSGLLARAGRITEECTTRGLITGAETDTRRDTPEARLILDREAFAFNNVQVEAVENTLQAAIGGITSARLHSAEEDTDIRVRLKREYTDTEEELGRLRIPSPGGAVELSLLAEIRQALIYGELSRLNRKPAVGITFQAAPGEQMELKAFLSGLEGPNTMLASASALAPVRRQMILLFVLAVVLMYLIVGAQFESLLAGLLVLGALPLSMSGSLVFLLLTGSTVNLNSFLGLLILLGISLNTTILLAAACRRRGAGLAAVVRGSVSRLTPVLATTLTTVCALLPLLFLGKLQSHMATAVIGGLLSGTPAALLIFPPAYAGLLRLGRRHPAGRRSAGRRPGA